MSSRKPLIVTMSAKNYVSRKKAHKGFVIDATMTDPRILAESARSLRGVTPFGEIPDLSKHTIVVIGLEPAHNGAGSNTSDKSSNFEENYAANEAFAPIQIRIRNALTPTAEVNDGRTRYLVVADEQIEHLDVIGEIKRFREIEKMREKFRKHYCPKNAC